jgi:hypothetical protein
MNTKKLRQTTDMLERQESSVATGHGKLKFLFHANKIFTLNFGLLGFGTHCIMQARRGRSGGTWGTITVK